MEKMKIEDDGTIVCTRGVIKRINEVHQNHAPQANVAEQEQRRWWEINAFYWLITIASSFLIAIPISIYLAPSWFNEIYTCGEGYDWFSNMLYWISEALRVSSPWAMGVGGIAGTVTFGIFHFLNEMPYRITDYIFSVLCILGGMLILPVALFLLTIVLGLAIVVAIGAGVGLLIKCLIYYFT